MDIYIMITIISGIPTIMTILASTVTIIWFIRDVRKENSKLLKEMTRILEKIEEGQRVMVETQTKGFETLSQILKDHTAIFNEILVRLNKKH